MDYRPLGKTGLTVSVAGLGCGGNSRLGLGRGSSFDDCVSVVRTAVDLGVTFLDTAEAYGTEEIVGAAARSYDRDRLVISTKAIFRSGDTGETVTRRVALTRQPPQPLCLLDRQRHRHPLCRAHTEKRPSAYSHVELGWETSSPTPSSFSQPTGSPR